MEQETELLKRTSCKALEDILGKKFNVLNEGFVRVIDFMGDSGSICQMARVSYGKGTKSVNEDRGLIRYLIRHKHTSPLEGNEIKLHLKMPIFVMRQWIRHRMANVNEYSMRYSEPKDEFFVPAADTIQLQSTDNKQGRGGEVEKSLKEEFITHTETTAKIAMDFYADYNEAGFAREMNRINLPLTAYTECYWKIDLHNLLHFLKLRCDPHAQYEIRVYADIILHEIVKVWVPEVYEAFVDYIKEATTFSKQEMEVLKSYLSPAISNESITESLEKKGVSKREAIEFIKKVRG